MENVDTQVLSADCREDRETRLSHLELEILNIQRDVPVFNYPD